MFGKRNRETDQLLTKMERTVDLIWTALIVRDPGTPLSADAYEGLRKQVIASSTARREHVAQLAEIDVALQRDASAEDLAQLVSQWLNQADIERVEDPARREVWETTLPAGASAEVEIPAYFDRHTGTIVRQGRLKAKADRAVLEPVAAPPILDEVATHSDKAPRINDPGAKAGEAEPADAIPNAAAAESSSATANDETSEEK
jgi:hypothetical protein